MATTLRPRTALEIIDASFQLMRKHYLEMVAVAGVVIVPLAALELILPLGLAVLFMFLRTIMSLVVVGAIIHVASQAYLGYSVSIGEALQVMIRRFLPLLVAVMLQTFMIILGFIFLIIPGILLTAWLFAVPSVVVLENSGPLDAIGRSYELSKGFVLKIFGIFLLTYLVYMLAIGALFSVALIGGQVEIGEQTINFLVNVLSVLIMPLWACVAVVLYYDLRIRKEGFDLQMMASQLESTPAQAR
jgi:hypothetical protein